MPKFLKLTQFDDMELYINFDLVNSFHPYSRHETHLYLNSNIMTNDNLDRVRVQESPEQIMKMLEENQ